MNISNKPQLPGYQKKRLRTDCFTIFFVVLFVVVLGISFIMAGKHTAPQNSKEIATNEPIVKPEEKRPTMGS
jgi:hypothetical protein